MQTADTMLLYTEAVLVGFISQNNYSFYVCFLKLEKFYQLYNYLFIKVCYVNTYMYIGCNMGLMAEKRKRQQEKKSKPSETEPAKKTVKVDPIPGLLTSKPF